jgi:hypothetical protein
MLKKTVITSIIAFTLFSSVTFALNIGLAKNITSRKLGDDYPAAVSPDQSRAAILERAKLFKVRLLIDGKPGNIYDAIDPKSVVFSPDSQNVAYFAKRNETWILVIGNEEVKLCNAAKGYPMFSNDSKRCAVMIRDNNGWMAFVSGEENLKSYLNVKALQFSPNLSRIGYLAQLEDKKWVAVIDHQERLPYTDIKWLIFSHDGQHVAYCVRNGEKEFVVVDGKEEQQYDEILDSNFGFSPDSEKLVL